MKIRLLLLLMILSCKESSPYPEGFIKYNLWFKEGTNEEIYFRYRYVQHKKIDGYKPFEFDYNDYEKFKNEWKNEGYYMLQKMGYATVDSVKFEKKLLNWYAIPKCKSCNGLYAIPVILLSDLEKSSKTSKNE